MTQKKKVPLDCKGGNKFSPPRAKAAGPVVRAQFHRSRLSSLTQRYLLLETKVDNSSVNGGRIRPIFPLAGPQS